MCRYAKMSLPHNMFHVKLKVYIVVPKFQCNFCINLSTIYHGNFFITGQRGDAKDRSPYPFSDNQKAYPYFMNF